MDLIIAFINIVTFTHIADFVIVDSVSGFFLFDR